MTDFINAPPSTTRRPLDPSALAAFETVIRGRRSVRRFLPDPVPNEVIERIIDAAGWAPSPHGTQPWRFAVLTRPETKERLADAMGSTWRHNLEMDDEPAEVIAARLAGSRRRLLEAPVLILVSLFTDDLDRYPDPDRAAAERTMAIQSLGACVQNMLITAFALGVDSGWMCAPLFCPDVVVEVLGLDPRLTPHALLAIGHAAADPKRRPRRPQEILVTFDDR